MKLIIDEEDFLTNPSTRSGELEPHDLDQLLCLREQIVAILYGWC